jgi:hypothetical protein
MWKAQVDRYRDVPFDGFVADGTVVAHQIVSEAKARDQFGGTVIPNDVLDEMAAYSKSIWPTMPTLVRADATDLEEHAAGYETPMPAWTPPRRATWLGRAIRSRSPRPSRRRPIGRVSPSRSG